MIDRITFNGEGNLIFENYVTFFFFLLLIPNNIPIFAKTEML